MPVALLLATLSVFDACEAEFSEAEDPRSAYMCFYFTAQNETAWEEGARRVDEIIDRFPDRRAWLELVRGHIRSERDEEAAEASYRAAAAEFASAGTADGEILARNNLTRILQRQRRHGEAEREIERVIEVAERSGSAELMARARISEADYLTANGREVARAYRALQRAEALAFPDGSRGLKRRVLSALGQVAFATGRLDESIGAYERLLQLLLEEDDAFAASMILFNIADARYRKLEYLPSAAGREEVLRLTEEALGSAEASENRRAEAYALQLLVELTPHDEQNEAQVRDYAERCVDVARELGHPDRVASCLWALAELLAETGDEGWESVMSEALNLALEAESNWYMAYAWSSRARISWKTKDYEDAVEDARAALESVETLRQLQDEERGRVELFSDWTQDYYTLSGKLLEHGDLDEAFSVMERMRARALLESLTASAALPVPPPEAIDGTERARLLQEIARVQRRLLDPRLTPESRERELEQLERLELDEAELASRSPGEAHPVLEPDFVSLDGLRRALANNQAVLSFQVGLESNVRDDFGGGAWLTVVSKDEARAFRLPDRVALHAKIPLFLGLVARRDGAETVAAGALYEELVADAVDSLSSDVEELVIIPDGVLHHLPFAALRERGRSEALGERYALSLAPSATLWRRWRESPPVAASVPALALADPDLRLGSPSAATSHERSAFLRKGVALGSLPHARREGASLVDRLRHGSKLLTAADASERAVKRLDLSEYEILHFAAHALADDENPDRSAVVLSPGDENEDGLLQSREISQLGIDGGIVVLSACQTASGRTLNGEGVLSLARAFFEAGAHAVVASRWPLRDDEAALFFDDFYRELARGRSLAVSMREATARAVADGRPSAAWSGLTVYGNGSLTPVAPSERERGRRFFWPALSAVLAVAAIAAVARIARAQTS